jgi:N-acetylated-alpha-linked acidic dipeptidase
MENHAPNNEATPLIATVRVRPPRQRYPHSTLRRFFTVAFGSTVLAVVFFVLLPAALVPSHRHRPHRPARPIPDPSKPPQDDSPVSYKDLQDILLKTPKEKRLEDWSRYYTSGPHLAGKNYSQAEWTANKWREFGIANTQIVAYDTYINYPLGHRLALYEKTSSEKSHDRATGTSKPEAKGEWKVKFEASLEEDVLEDDSTTGLKDRIPTFHGYSASGNVTAPYVYVNYGTYQDFEDLLKLNISLSGNIAIAKYGGVFRGLKVKRAQELGMVGVVMYSDPGDDGGLTEENGIDAYPNGPARNPSSVQRGSAQFLSMAPGDPTTPGYPSKPGVPRVDANISTPSIPSLPISYMDAIPLLTALNGHGPHAKDLNRYWQRNLGLEWKGVQYHVGPSPGNVRLNLVNEQEYTITPIWNVIGIINGTLPSGSSSTSDVIIVGNHRDAWIAGGAGDPNSGSAALMEVVRGFGKALEKGWRPLRTVVFASWDGEEYGLIGSTEWVEEYLPWVKSANVAYVNMDVGCVGPQFNVHASPLLGGVIREVTGAVQSPNQTVKGQTVGDVWDGRIGTMGSGSDFTAFQDFAGVPSVDLGFGPSPGENKELGGAVYHYHSNYDSFHWMETFGDPGWHYHKAAAQVLGLMVATLVEAPVVPLNVSEYALALEGYVDSVARRIDLADGVLVERRSREQEEDEDEARFRPSATSEKGSLLSLRETFKRLPAAVKALQDTASKFQSRASELADRAGRDIPWWKWLSKAKLYYEIRKVNEKIKFFERQFLYEEGLDGRGWFKHVVFAPGLWTGYAGGEFLHPFCKLQTSG